MKHAGIVLALLACALNFVGLADHGLWLPDEPREAEIAREYSVREGWVVPWLNGGRWLEKPPLYHWCAAALFQWTGHASPWAARLPSALAGVVLGACAWVLARRLGRPELGPWAAFLTWTSAELLNAAHSAMVDAMFAAWVTLALTGFVLGGTGYLFTALFAALAFLTKFHLGPVLIGGAIGGWCWVKGDWTPLRRLLSPLPVIVFLAVALPWPLLVYHYQGEYGPEALKEMLWGQLFARSVGGSFGHAQSPLYYLPLLFTFAAPASLALLPALPWAWKRRKENPLAGLGLVWLGSALLILSVPASKRVIYLTPCVVPAALLAAAWGQGRLGRLAPVLGGGLILAILGVDAVLVPKLNARYSVAPLAAELKREAGHRTIEGYGLSENLQGALAFELGQQVRSFSEPGPLVERLGFGRRLVVMPRERYEELEKDARAAPLMRLALEQEAAGVRFVVVQSVP